jgi:hypothetical protein
MKVKTKLKAGAVNPLYTPNTQGGTNPLHD